MTAKEYYDVLRKQGFTDSITCDPEPDYRLEFYQTIFNVMEGYASIYHEAKMKVELKKFNDWMCGKQYDGQIPLIGSCINEYLKHREK